MLRNFLTFTALVALCGLFAAAPGQAQSQETGDKNLSLANPATQADETDLNAEQIRVFRAGKPRPGSLQILTLLDRADATYGIGETLRLAVKSNEAAYITVFSVGASGRTTQLFPNGYESNNHIRAGQTLEIPSAASETRIKVTGPVGRELIKVIATSKPVKVVPEAHYDSSTGLFRTLAAGAEELDRDLEVVSANPPGDLKLAIINQVIRTVPARLTAASSEPGVASDTMSGDTAGRFPLLLAVDKQSYHVGEPITMTVTPMQSCYLTVIATDNSGRSRRIFPSTAMPSRQVTGRETLVLSGSGAPQTFTALRPGHGTVRAVCTTEARTANFRVRAVTEDLSEEEKEQALRDLAVVPAQPARLGIAEVSFGIVP